jgi:hypothetical protein
MKDECEQTEPVSIQESANSSPEFVAYLSTPGLEDWITSHLGAQYLARHQCCICMEPRSSLIIDLPCCQFKQSICLLDAKRLRDDALAAADGLLKCPTCKSTKMFWQALQDVGLLTEDHVEIFRERERQAAAQREQMSAQRIVQHEHEAQDDADNEHDQDAFDAERCERCRRDAVPCSSCERRHREAKAPASDAKHQEEPPQERASGGGEPHSRAKRRHEEKQAMRDVEVDVDEQEAGAIKRARPSSCQEEDGGSSGLPKRTSSPPSPPENHSLCPHVLRLGQIERAAAHAGESKEKKTAPPSPASMDEDPSAASEPEPMTVLSPKDEAYWDGFVRTVAFRPEWPAALASSSSSSSNTLSALPSSWYDPRAAEWSPSNVARHADEMAETVQAARDLGERNELAIRFVQGVLVKHYKKWYEEHAPFLPALQQETETAFIERKVPLAGRRARVRQASQKADPASMQSRVAKWAALCSLFPKAQRLAITWSDAKVAMAGDRLLAALVRFRAASLSEFNKRWSVD